LNSTFTKLFQEIDSYLLTGAINVAKMDTWSVESFKVLNSSNIPRNIKNKIIEAFNKLKIRPIEHILKEIGANSPEEVSLAKVKPDRRELDKIVMGEILGLSEEEQLEVYRAVVDLVKSRIEKAGSVPRQAKRKGVDIDALAEGILRELDTSELKKFPGDYIGDAECREIEVPKGKPEVGSDLHGFFVKIGDMRVECTSQEEAKYIEYAVLNGNARIRIPEDERIIKKAVESYGSAYNKLKRDVSAYTRRTIQNDTIREKVELLVLERVTRY
jgi:hypothetical protein